MEPWLRGCCFLFFWELLRLWPWPPRQWDQFPKRFVRLALKKIGTNAPRATGSRHFEKCAFQGSGSLFSFKFCFNKFCFSFSDLFEVVARLPLWSGECKEFALAWASLAQKWSHHKHFLKHFLRYRFETSHLRFDLDDQVKTGNTAWH